MGNPVPLPSSTTTSSEKYFEADQAAAGVPSPVTGLIRCKGERVTEEERCQKKKYYRYRSLGRAVNYLIPKKIDGKMVASPPPPRPPSYRHMRTV